MNRFFRFLSLPLGRRALLVKAAVALLRAAWQVRRWSFARLAATLGQAVPVTAGGLGDAETPSTSAAPGATDVQWAISVWSRRWPWPPTCFMQALAARELLIAQGLPSDLYFGVRGSQERAAGSDETPAIGAHAWLCCGKHLVTGASEAQQHRPIALYRSPGATGSALP